MRLLGRKDFDADKKVLISLGKCCSNVAVQQGWQRQRALNLPAAR
jgi:hypothetical protein